MNNIVFVGLDVHKATIAVAVAEGGRGGEVLELGNFINRLRRASRFSSSRRGETGIAVGSMEQLETVLATSIAAMRAGELDRLLEASTAGEKRAIPRAKKAA